MALIQCPECNQLISDRASKCPKCGFPIQVQSDAQPEEATAGNDSPLENTPANPPKRKSLKRVLFNKKWVFIVAACLAVIVVLAIVFSSRSITVEDISISKWRLTDSSEYFDCYEGIVSSEQKRPFVAVIGY